MKRYVQITGLIVLAFAASGWGSIVAAALCPHARPSVNVVLTHEDMAEDHSCCPAKLESASKQSCHDSAPEEKMTARAGHERQGRALITVAPSLLESASSCAHCMGGQEPKSSVAIVRASGEQKRSLEPVSSQTATLAQAPSSFSRPVLYRQGAPPGPLTPKHLLLGVLLI